MSGITDESPYPTEPGLATSDQALSDLPGLRAVLERASDLSLLLDRQFRISWVSPSLPAMWEYASNALIGSDARTYVHPDDQQVFASLLDRVTEVTGAHDRCDMRVRDGGGQWRWVEVRVSNQLDDPNVASLVLTTVDISERRQAQDDLVARDRFYAAVLAGAMDVALVCEADTTMRWVSPSGTSICGHGPDQIAGLKLADLVHPDDLPAFNQLIHQVVRQPGAAGRVETRMRYPDGLWRWSEHRVTNLLDDDAVRGLVFNTVDIDERRTVHEDLQSREQFLRVILETAHEGVWVVDTHGRTAFANQRMAEMLRVPLDLLVDHALDDVVEETLAADIRERLLRRQQEGGAETYDLCVQPQGRSTLWVTVTAAPLPPGFSKAVPDGGTVALVADITERKAYEESLRHQALHDQLTGLPNRALLGEQLQTLTDRYERTGAHFSYLLCNIDGLQIVNDALGSEHGDEVIAELGRRLAEAARDGDVVARTTGDEFVVVCVGTEAFQAERIARDLVVDVAGRLDVAGSTLWPSISIGVASTSDVQPPALATAAGAALQRAKRHGRGSACVFNAAAPRDHRAELELLADLREAATSGALQMHYQPVVTLGTNTVAAAEALMRWSRPGHGDVPPSVFIPIAEEAGLAPALGAWSLQQACDDAARWPGDLQVAVNLSARQLTEDLVGNVRYALAHSSLPPHRLWLEVTETALFADAAAAAAHLQAVADLGVKISLDDFGTGYSSLVYLRDLPVHALKIDRSFVAGLGQQADDAAIVQTLIGLGASLNVGVVAEGVETAQQAYLLRRLGCQLAQGYLWSPAVPAADFVSTVNDIGRSQTLRRERPPRRTSQPVEPGLAARILAMHRQGASPTSIAAALNAEGVTAPSGKRWHRNTVAHLISERQP